MAADTIRLEALGEDVVVRQLSRFTESVKDYRPAFATIVKRLEDHAAKQFASQGKGEWAPLSPAYARWKEANFPGRPLLRLTDDLYNSLVKENSKSVREVKELTLKWGTKVPYGTFHQLGTRRMPARRIIALSVEEKRTIVKDIQAYIVVQARKALNG